MILDIEDDSFLSPIFVGFHTPREGYATAKDAFAKACVAVPPVQSSRKRMVGRRQSVSDPYSREVVCYAGVPKETLSGPGASIAHQVRPRPTPRRGGSGRPR